MGLPGPKLRVDGGDRVEGETDKMVPKCSVPLPGSGVVLVRTFQRASLDLFLDTFLGWGSGVSVSDLGMGIRVRGLGIIDWRLGIWD